jgi:hypothetical protein
MDLLQDYVIAENARSIGEEYLADSLTGIFIGTRKYFFFIPVTGVEMTRKGLKTIKQPVNTFYKKKPVDEVVLSMVNKLGLNVSDFEKFVIQDLKKAIPQVKICDLGEIEQYKLYVRWWGSGILCNTSTGKTGWKPFVSRFKSAKRSIKSFYKGDPKMVG